MPDRFSIGNGLTIHDKIKDGLYGENIVPMEWERPPAASPDSADHAYGGDLKGVIEKLDYIQNLGADTIYLTPFFDSPSYHKYDALDFKSIDKAF